MSNARSPFLGKTTIRVIKESLGEHFTTINSFFRTAFKLIDFAINGAEVFVVFIARRCFVLACVFLRSLYSEHEDKYLDYLSKIYSDGGLRILAKRIARNYFINDDYKCIIFLFDDILIHGRAVSGLLSSAEEIFAEEYLTLKRLNPGIGREYTKKQLYDKFLEFIIIKTGYTSTQPDLLRERYKARLDRDDVLMATPRKWRDASNRISKLIYQSETPNAAFVPGLLFSDRFLNRDIIRESFISAKNDYRESAICDWKYIKNDYKGRNTDFYMLAIPSYGDVHTVFTIRCTDNYLMPLVFLPKFENDSNAWSLAADITGRLKDIGYSDVLNLLRVFYGFQRVEKLSNMYTELITMIYSVTLMRAFLAEIHCDLREHFVFDSERYINSFTTVPAIMGNYAHNTAIKHVLSFLMDPDTDPLFSLREIEARITYYHKMNNFIIDYPYYCDEFSLNQEEEKRLVGNLERAIFRFGMDSEVEAYRLSTGVFVPSDESVEYFYFPKNNDIKKVIESIYQEDGGWMRNHASLYTVFAYLLQMMDYGNLGLITGTIDNHIFTQCLKAGEQSLNVEASKFALALPIMNEIEQRCRRQGRLYIGAFSDELDYFNRQARYYLVDNQNQFLQEACDIMLDKEKADEIIEFESGLISAGHKSSDYMFALEEELGKRDISASQFKKECHDFYYRVVY